MTTELYPTKELSRLTGVPDSTIRAWKSRGKLTTDLYVDADGSTLWKASAIAAIQAIQGNAPITDTVTTATHTDAAVNLSRYDTLADVLGAEIATQLKAGDFWQRVDRAVVRSLLADVPPLPSFNAVCAEFFVEPYALSGYVSLPSSEVSNRD